MATRKMRTLTFSKQWILLVDWSAYCDTEGEIESHYSPLLALTALSSNVEDDVLQLFGGAEVSSRSRPAHT